MDNFCDVAKSLETNLVKFGTIPEQKNVLGKPFPLVLVPVEGEKVNFIQLQEYFQKNHENVRKASSLYGAVMFKGFDILSGEEWASVLFNTGIKEMPYVGGAAVRKLIVGHESRIENLQVVTTNESPPSEPIPFHHELAQTPDPPSHILFYCQVNAAEGGSTPLIRSDLVYNYLQEKHADFIKKAEELGVKYIRTVPEVDDPTSAQGRSWKSMFHVNTREEAEAEMTKREFTWKWHDNGNCTVISKVLPVSKVSSNGNKTFFNQVVAAYTGWSDSRNEYGKSVVYGDDTPLPKDSVEDLVAFMDKEKCAYTWTPGQFVMVDNSVTYHSRQVFKGKRRAFASIGNGTKDVSFNQTALTLTSGDKMPSVGFGCWKVSKEELPG